MQVIERLTCAYDSAMDNDAAGSEAAAASDSVLLRVGG